MKRAFFIFHFSFFIALLAFAQSSSATGRADQILERLAAGFRTMGAYSVTFEVAAGEYTTRGSYAVEGERYYMILGDAEVFCDGKIRWEVDNRRREITLSGVDSKSRNILNNPAHAFDFLGSEYAPSLISEGDGRAVVKLSPRSKSAAATGDITLTLSTATMRPASLAYEYDGGRVDVRISRIEPLKSPLKNFDKSQFDGYEVIDFR